MKSKISVNPRNSEWKSVGNSAWFLLCLVPAVVLGYEINDHSNISSKKPVRITANQLTFDRLNSLTVFKGYVVATHEKVRLKTDQLRAFSDNREATALGHVKVVDSSSGMTLTCGNLEYLDLMETMTAHDHPLLTAMDENGMPLTVQGRQIELDNDKKTVAVNQNVDVSSADGHATARNAVYISREDKLILEGDPSVAYGNGKISGRRIISNLGQNRRVFAEGMAEAVFSTDSSGNTSTALRGNSTPGVPGKGPGSLPGGDSSHGNPGLTPTPTPGHAPFMPILEPSLSPPGH